MANGGRRFGDARPSPAAALTASPPVYLQLRRLRSLTHPFGLQLNDVVSLIVALQALKLAESTTTSSSKYSYGWQRAEVLGALINGVFLLALCFSIGLEAITRFFNATEISNPKLIVAVGSAGLVSNLVGLLLFADVGHGGHSHGGGGGHGHSHAGAKGHAQPDERGHGHSHGGEPGERTSLLAAGAGVGSNVAAPGSSARGSDDENSDEDGDDVDGALLVHPGEFREHIVKVAQVAGYGAAAGAHAGPSKAADHGHAHDGHSHGADEHDGHDDHAAAGPSEGSMNMRGVFLHVLGDAVSFATPAAFRPRSAH